MKKTISVSLILLMLFVCLTGCNSDPAKSSENPNLPQAEVVFPKTTWGVSANDVKDSYSKLYETTDENGADGFRFFTLDELEFCGEKMNAEFTFLAKEDKTWLCRVELTTVDPMTDKELLAFTEKDEVKEIEDSNITGTVINAGEEKNALLDKNRAYLGWSTDGIRPSWNMYTVNGEIKTEDDGKHYTFVYEGMGFLFTSYDLEAGEQFTE